MNNSIKRLFLIWVFSWSLDCFCQVSMDRFKLAPDTIGWPIVKRDWIVVNIKPDTIRATLIVYYDSGPAILHTKPGFVIFQYSKDEVYLDDKKRIIKSPLEVFSYKIKQVKP